ncbi:MAG: PEGA domain-containing protein [Myxococcales bacterium]|nr:PEGA domain-containing protein [Myxococcales bacterium]
MNRTSLPVLAALALFGCIVAASSTTYAQRGTIAVNVESTPAGAQVFVDDESSNPIGTTPLRRVRILRGQRTLIFKKEGHETTRLPINVRRAGEVFRATLPALGTITVLAGNPDVANAAVRIDGQPVGNVPTTNQVQPGRHMVQVSREGYVTFTQWVEVSGGQVLTLPVILEREAPRTGSILVAADVSGAEVFVDGQSRGQTPAIIEGLEEGDHVIEVRPTAEGQNPHRETVRVIAMQRAVVHATLRPAPSTGGSLRVLVNARGAIVFLDGEAVGEAPATATDVAPGEHIVEARAEGYEPVQRTVTIEQGRQQVLSIELQRVALPPGRIVVNANVEGATVLVDGEERGVAPVVLSEVAPGTHAIIVRARGHREFRTTCDTAPGQNCEIDATLSVVGAPVRVVANVRGAQLYVDGEPVGPVPFEGDIPSGSHVLSVRADGYREHTEQSIFAPSDEARVIEVFLVREGELTEEEIAARNAARRERHRQAVARSAATLPDDLALLDFSAGWPHLLEGRLGIGIFDWLEAGVGMRTFFRLTEFEGRVKAGWRPVPQFSFGAQVRFGGGIGPNRSPTARDEMVNPDAPNHPTNSFFTSVEGLLSLHFLNAGNFTLWAGFDFTSDRWGWNARDSDCRSANGCMDDGTPIRVDGSVNTIAGRQNLARFRLGGSLEFILTKHWNAWGSFEGAFGQPRRILGDVFGGGNEDLQLYFRLGVTYKFDVARTD